MDSKTLGIIGVLGLIAVLFWPSGSSQKVKTLFEEAENYMQAKRYQDAIAKYQEALEESVKPLVKTEVIDPDFETLAKYKIAYAYTQIAEETGDLTKYDEALKIIEPLYARATVPVHRELITYLWGYVLFKQERYEEAEPKFREVIQNFPQSRFLENAWYSIAQLNFELNEYDKAREAYKQIVDNFPNSSFRDDAQYLIAQTFLLEEDYEQAYREFDKLTPEAFQNSPLIPEANYKAAYCLLQLDRLEEAIDRYNRFVTDFPDSVLVTGAYFDLGTIYTRQKDYDNAIQNYQLALETTEDMKLRAEIQYEIGDNYLDAEDYTNAIEAYRQVIELYPTSPYVPAARFGVGEAYMALAGANTTADSIDVDNYHNAIAAYQDVLNENPDSEYVMHATFQIAEAYYQTKEYESALQWYETVIDKYPDDPLAGYALYGALWSLSELGRNDEVLTRGRAFIQQHINDPDFDLQAAEIQMKIGDILFDSGDYLKAAEEYRRVTELEDLPKFYAVKLRSYYQMGVSFFKAGEEAGDDASLFEKAIPPLQAAIDKYSDEVFNLDYEFPERAPLLENAIMNKAHVHEKLGQWAEARDTYALIKPGSENFGRTRILIAEAYEKEGNVDEAIARYRAIADDQTLGETWQSLGAIRLADLLRGQERWQEAADAYASIVERYPESKYVDAAQYLIGVCYYSMEPRTVENLKTSIEAFKKVIDQNPDSENAPDALYGMILSTKTLAEQGKADWNEVVALATQLEDKYGDRTDPRAQKAVSSGNLLKVIALEKLGASGIDSMVASLRQVVASPAAEVDAKVTAQLKIGNLLFEAERFGEAAPEYAKLGEMFPKSEHAPVAFYQAAVSAYKEGEIAAETDENEGTPWFQKATEYTAKALEYPLDPNMQVSVNYTRGLALSKVGNLPLAIQSLKNVTGLAGQVTEPDRVALVEASHIELARLYLQLGQYQDAVAEYQYLAENSNDRMTRTRSYLSAAEIDVDNLGDKEAAVTAYLAAAALADEKDPLAAQALYQSGLLLSELFSETQDASYADRAIKAFEELQSRFADVTDNSNVQLMIADGAVRTSDLYIKTGKVDEAIAKARDARDRALKTNDIVQRVQAQYQLANLLARQARTLFDSTEGAANTEYKAASREAVQEYLKVIELAEPLDQAPPDAIVFVGPALFQAGAISYSVHGPVDLPIAVDALDRFATLADEGVIQADDSDLKSALYYAGVAYYDLGRGNEMDATMFAKSAAALQRLVDRYPKDKDAGLWQFQVGEAYFAAQRYKDALKAYLAVVDRYPKDAKAAEALYSAAACYGQLGDAKNVFAMYERLANEYPSSEYAAEAFISVGDSRYNDSISLSGEEQIAKLKEALSYYERVLDLPNASDQAKKTAKGYILDTSELLASLEYAPIEERFNEALASEDPEAIRKSIQEFEKLIATYPESSSANVALTKIGDAYVALEEWQKALDTYNRLLSRWIDESGKPMTPSDEYVGRALNYARTQYVQINAYLKELQGEGK